MREMKDSGIEWIGEIPADWETRKIKQLADSNTENSFVDGDWIESPYIVDSGIRYLTTGNIGDGVFKEQGNGYITLKTFGELACKYAFPGDLIISRLNAPYGRSCILPSDYTEYVVAVDNVILRTQEDKRYICYVSQCDGYKHAVEDDAKGTTMKRISRINLGNIVIPLPPIQQQHRIADYLDRKCSQIDSIITRQQEVIEKLKAYKLSVITEAVTKGLNPHVPMKDSGVDWIGEIPDFWNVVPLKTCSDILPGYAFSSDDFDTENGTALLRGINVTPNGVRWEDVVYWNKPITEQLRAFELVADDIVVGLDRPWVSEGTRVCWVTQKDLPALLLQRVCRIRAKENIDSRWIYHWIASKSFQEALSIETTGVSVPHISTKQIGQFNITLPPIEVQCQICDILEAKHYSINKIVSKKQAIIDKLTEYKKSLIYEVVTGKKEV